MLFICNTISYYALLNKSILRLIFEQIYLYLKTPTSGLSHRSFSKRLYGFSQYHLVVSLGLEPEEFEADY